MHTLGAITLCKWFQKKNSKLILHSLHPAANDGDKEMQMHDAPMDSTVIQNKFHRGVCINKEMQMHNAPMDSTVIQNKLKLDFITRLSYISTRPADIF